MYYTFLSLHGGVFIGLVGGVLVRLVGGVLLGLARGVLVGLARGLLWVYTLRRLMFAFFFITFPSLFVSSYRPFPRSRCIVYEPCHSRCSFPPFSAFAMCSQGVPLFPQATLVAGAFCRKSLSETLAAEYGMLECHTLFFTTANTY